MMLVFARAAPAVAQTSDELFDDGTLHEIRLVLHSVDWAKLKAEFDQNTYYPADMEWRGLKVRNVGIRSRGLGTRNGVKPGLRVDMNRYASGQRFLGMRSLVLDNAYRDISLMRDRISMKLFARLGLTPPRLSHARLFVNNEYAGLYVMTEELGEDFVRRVFKQGDSDEPDKGTLFEYNWLDEWHFDYLGADFAPYKARFEAKTHEKDSDFDMYAPIEQLVRLVNETPPERLLEAVDPLLDLRQLVTYFAVEAYLVDYDGLVGFKGMANFYLFRSEGATRLRLVPWDKDQAFYVANRDPWFGVADNVLLRKALEIPELRTLFLDTLYECARVSSETPDGGAGPWMDAEITRGIAQTREAALADPGRWFGVEDYQIEIDRMLEFARTRAEFTRCVVDNARGATPERTCTAPGQTAPR